jgi:hypothetical protein
VRAPEGNGRAERIIRTLKEHLLWVRTFATVLTASGGKGRLSRNTKLLAHAIKLSSTPDPTIRQRQFRCSPC